MQTSESHRATGSASRGRLAPGPLQVVCFSTYVSEPTLQSSRHPAARSFLLALRGERVEGVSRIPVGADERELTAANANDSIDWFGEMVARHLKAHRIDPPFAIVPVPTSACTLDSSSSPWTSLLAIAIASNGADHADIVDALRWKRPVAAPGRRRDTAAELYENLAVTRKLDPDVPVLLVDYLFTSAATVRACASRLAERGVRTLVAVCAGRTTTRADHDAFATVTAEIPELVPGH